MMPANQQDAITTAVARLAAINAQIAELDQQGKALKSFLRLALGPGTHTTGDMRVSVIPRQVFDPDKAIRVIPPDQLPLVTVTKQYVDARLARKVLPSEIYSECCTETQPQVRIA